MIRFIQSDGPALKGVSMFGFLVSCVYTLVTGDFPGYLVMGVQEDSAIVGVLLDLHSVVA